MEIQEDERKRLRVARSRIHGGAGEYDPRCDNNLGLFCLRHSLPISVYRRAFYTAEVVADEMTALIAPPVSAWSSFERIDTSLNVSDYSPAIGGRRKTSASSEEQVLAKLLTGEMAPDRVPHGMVKYVQDRFGNRD